MTGEYFYNQHLAQASSLSEKMVAGWAAATMFLTSISFVFVLRNPVIIGIGVGLIAVDILVNRRIYFDYSIGVIALVAALVFIMAFGAVASRAPTYGHEKLTVLSGWLLYFLLIAGYVKRFLPFFLKSGVLFGILYLLLLIYQFGDPFTFFNTATANSQRLGINYEEGGEIFNPIWLSRYIGVFVLSYVCLSGRFTLAGILIYTAAALYIISAASKGPILSLASGILAYLVLSERISWQTCLFILLTIGIGVVAGSFAAEASGNQYLSERFSIFGSSGGDRMGLMRHLLNDIYQHGNIFLGRGTGATGYILSAGDTRAYPHNIFMEVFYENGVLGVCALLGLLLVVFMQVLKKKGWEDIVLFCFFIYFFMNALFSGDLEFNQYLFLFALTVVSGNRTVLL